MKNLDNKLTVIQVKIKTIIGFLFPDQIFKFKNLHILGMVNLKYFMNRQIALYIIINLIFFQYSFAQESLNNDTLQTVLNVFSKKEPLPIKLSFQIKDIKRNTNDSTYINSSILYHLKDRTEQSINIQIRRRGNYRLKNCYFPPVTIKLNKEDTKNTPFEGHKKLKLVMPCLLQKNKNDNVIKEYLAYKLFETISPYHFKTRLVDVTFEEAKGQKVKTHFVKGILIEDDKSVARRFDGKAYKRYSHPLNHEPIASVKNTIFQYMIGNTDFSQAYLHNMKLIFVNNKMIPLPYDFDMSGLVNCSYAVVSQIQGENLGLTSVKQRKYRGFIRDKTVFNQVRKEILEHQGEILSILNNHEKYFQDPKEFKVAKDYILSFFAILIDEKKFKNEIIDSARNE